MIPAASSVSSATRVFSIPELLSLIASDISSTDQVYLSQVCRRTFDTLIPTIWKDVNGAEHLLRLISSASLLRDESTGQLEKIVFNEQLGAQQFERFDIYAPFVEILKVYCDEEEYFAVSGWSLLISRAQERPLLPTLKQLSVACLDHTVQVSDTSIWLRAFGGHTIDDMRVTERCRRFNRSDKPMSMTPATASATFHTLVRHCPNIQLLAMCPRQLHVYGDTLGLNRSSKPWHNYLQDLTSLRQLSLADGWISYSSLVAIGQLPLLEELHLHVGLFKGFRDTHVAQYDPPSSAFHALRYLSLTNVSSPHVSDILDLGKLRILGNITHLQIVIAAEPNMFTTQNDWVANKLLPSLVNARCLQTFQILPYIGYPIENLVDMYQVSILEAQNIMPQIPLETVYWDHMYLGEGRLTPDLGIIWPNVTKLFLPAQYAELQELSCIATMPKLTHLEISLSLTSTFTPNIKPGFNHAPLETIASSTGVHIAPDFDIMEHNVRVLLQLWPSLSELTWGEDEEPIESASYLLQTLDRLFMAHSTMNMAAHRADGQADLANMRYFVDVLRRAFAETMGANAQ